MLAMARKTAETQVRPFAQRAYREPAPFEFGIPAHDNFLRPARPADLHRFEEDPGQWCATNSKASGGSGPASRRVHGGAGGGANIKFLVLSPATRNRAHSVFLHTSAASAGLDAAINQAPAKIASGQNQMTTTNAGFVWDLTQRLPAVLNGDRPCTTTPLADTHPECSRGECPEGPRIGPILADLRGQTA